MKLLLIEDDALLGEGIKSALNHFSYVVDWVKNGRDGISALNQDAYSLAILDLGLPDQDGLTLLKNIRQDKKNNLPILILTARGELEDKLAGLDAGADDYMVKPFDVRELEARVRTLTRRSDNRRTDCIELGRARLHINQRILQLDGEEIEFSRREFPLVQAFFSHPKQIYTREALESLSYGWDDDIESNALEVHIHRLRKKLGTGAIKTVRGVGYMLVEEFFA